MATTSEVLEKSTKYFDGDELAASVFLKYALSTPQGDWLESTPEQMHWRLADEFARIEAKYPNPLTADEIFTYLDHFEYIIPQGSPMAGIGNPYQNMSISNCFVIQAPYDSYGGILKTDQEEAQIMKRRGGVGFDISTLRPKGMHTKNAAKTTTGILGFMERFSNTCREVGQDGRRGALMLSISVHHPEIETFATAKLDRTKVTGANISIRLSDEFMNAVKNGTDYELRWPVDSPDPVYSEMVSAKLVWDKIISAAHDSAEPGLLFWDTIKRSSPADVYPQFTTQSVNPCGEITLSEYDSCRLLLVNVASFVENPFTKDAYFDFAKYGEVAYVGQKLMDDIVDLELECIDKILIKIDKDPEPEDVKRGELELWNKIRKACVDGRRTGLGPTGVGDAIAYMNLKYGSDESIELVADIYRTQAFSSYRSSVDMARDRGAFPAYDYETERDHPLIQQVVAELPEETQELYKKYGRRNIANTTTAPAGSTSMETQTTSGIEPAIFVEYTRRKKINPSDGDIKPDYVDDMGDKWKEFTVYHHGVTKWMEITGESDVKKSPYWGATANDIDWVQKVKLQAAAQKWVCHAISNTTNLPEDVAVETVKDIYMTGWESGCFIKGTPVLTPDGLVNIENLESGDYVYSHDGSIQMITEAFELPAQKRVLAQIETYGLPQICATADHPFLILRSEKKNWDKTRWEDRENESMWVKADEIRETDYLLVPKLQVKTHGLESIKFSDYLQPTEYLVDEENIYPARMLPWKNSILQKTPRGISLPDEIRLTDEVLYFLGIFTAEGHFSRRSCLRINLNVSEIDIADRCQFVLENVFGLSVKRFNTESNNGVSLRLEWSSSIMSRWLETIIGRGSYNKHLPLFFRQLNQHSLKVLVGGHFDGDKGVTVSADLAKDLYVARLMMGQAPIFERSYGQGFDIHESLGTGSTGREFENFYAYRVRYNNLIPYNKEVYNLSVENTNTYNVYGIATHNCKGVTVYREGSRSGVMVVKEEEKSSPLQITQTQAPKRPLELPCDIHTMTVQGEKWTFFVGLLDDHPYEIMGGLSEYIKLPRRVKSGMISKHNGPKVPVARYDLHYDFEKGEDDETIIGDITNVFENPTYATFTRTLSLALRHGTPVQFVVEQLLKGTDEDLFSFSKAASRVLKHYIVDGTTRDKKCLECGANDLVYQEGCMICKACGSSKCG